MRLRIAAVLCLLVAQPATGNEVPICRFVEDDGRVTEQPAVYDNRGDIDCITPAFDRPQNVTLDVSLGDHTLRKEITVRSGGKLVFVDFPLELGNVEPFSVSFDALENGSMSIFGDGEEHQGAVDGISPIMGHFTLTHEGETTAPISVDATAEEVKTALENLSSIGSATVSKDLVGIRQASDGTNIVPGATSLYSIYSITFADPSEDGCHPGSWEKCPANIGDIAPLVVDTSLLSYDIGATQQQPAPSVEVYEVKKGSAGNLLEDAADGQTEIGFALSHNLVQGVGIDLSEVHELRCEALDATGSFELEVLGKRVLVDAQASTDDLKLLISNALGLTNPISTDGSTHGTVCHYNPSNPVTAVTKLTFSREDGPIPCLYVHSELNVAVSANNVVDAVDSIEYLGGGRYLVTYTPTTSGHYSASVLVNDEYLWTDVSAGVVVNPATASAHHCTHDSNLVAVAGKEESFAVVARDRFGNQLLSPSRDDSLVVSLAGSSDACSGAQRHENPNATIEELEVGNLDGNFRMAYTPSLAGVYESSIRLRSRGGLLATYFRNEDFSQPVYGNDEHNSRPYHETPWCAGDKPACDSTRRDSTISFDWGEGSPLPSDPTFPMDSFSVSWEGEIQVDVTDEYIFTVHLNGGVRLSVGDEIVIDNLPESSSEAVSSDSVALANDVFYPIKLEYAHSTDEAHVQLLWESLWMAKQVVPSSNLFYTRHIGGSSPSPYSVSVVPGDIDVSSTAQGEGLDECVSLEECSFVIQTKDFNDNNRFNNGVDPGFDVTIVGSGGWAGAGIVNSVVASSSPVAISDAIVTSDDWHYIGEADVTHLSDSLESTTSFVGTLLRGDRIAVDGTVLYTVSSEGTFDKNTVPLDSPYLGPTKSGVSVFKASKSCTSGTHTVKYTPSVRGTYEMDVKLPIVREVQRVTTSARSHFSLSGGFTLAYQGPSEVDPLVSDSIDFDASSEDLKTALESIEPLGSVEVSLHECSDPAVSCSWEVTFSSLEGDVKMLVPNTAQLGGDVAEVRVEEVAEGRRPKSITGFPRTLTVSPGPTSPSMTTAYGRGLVSALAGEEAIFTIQPKDSFGNDRLEEQREDLFAVYIYPEQADVDGSHPVTRGIIQREDEGFYTVRYVPGTSGFHTIVAVQAVSIEEQTITTGYNSKARGGTFAIKLGHLSTPPLPWDVDESTLKKALDSSMASISTFTVEKRVHGLFNFKHFISFSTLIGDMPDFTVDTSSLIGNANEWDVVSTTDGEFQHIKLDQPTHEIAAVNLEVLDPASVAGSSFRLGFMGQNTDPIPWDADESELLAKLEMLSTVGDIMVSLEDAAADARSWQITFNPYEGKSPKSLTNFGDLPQIEVNEVGAAISVETETVQEGRSPFRAFVSPAAPSAEKTTAYDHAGVPNYEGLSTGVYKSDTHFFVQSRDDFSNEIHDGPLREVQVIETSSSSQIGGFFEVSIFNSTVRIPASAFTSEVEKSLQSIPGLGPVDVSSNSAKDLVAGKTVAVTKGLDTLTPSEELSEFSVGDWIRIGDQDEGPIFSITDMSDVAPFTVTLSSPYLGESAASLNVCQHGSPQNRRGYQYIVKFDAALGDVPALTVDGALLEGDDAKVEITSCNWNVRQHLRTHASSTSPVEGHFYLVYGDEQTRLLSFDASAAEIEDAILSDITPIHSLSVTDEQDLGLGAKSWAIHLTSFDDDALLFFAEGHLLSGGTVAASAVCPVASSEDPKYSVETVAGRRGEDFVVELASEDRVRGTVHHIENGRYLATYTAPRVDDYSLSVQAAHFGGLTGEYFNNRWLHDAPVLTRVDQLIDFQWGKNDPVTPSGSKDFVSVRWTGYILPAYNETYTFTAHVNDALRLWIGDELLIDRYDQEVDDADEYVEFSASTSTPLRANQLAAIKIEYRENRGLAVMRLFWQSISQPFAIVDRHRLFYNASHIHGSPFEVIPQAIEPSNPTSCSLAIADWDSLQVDWSSPEDDGGSAVDKYLVEYWDASVPYVTEMQQLRIKQSIAGDFFVLSVDSHSTNVPIGASAMELEKLIESLPNVGDVEVLKTVESEYDVYDIDLFTDNAPVSSLSIQDVDQSEYCVCAKGGTTCDSGSSHPSCDAAASREGTFASQSVEIEVAEAAADDGFSHTIDDLFQSSAIPDGFGVRVSAGTSAGYGVPCPPTYLKPKGPPLPPQVVEINRVPSDPSSLALHFTAVTDPEDRAAVVSSYVVEWSKAESFLSLNEGCECYDESCQCRRRGENEVVYGNATLGADSIPSDRLSSYNGANKPFNYYKIADLSPGVEYFVRIAATNEAGTGPSARSSPLSLTPGSKPADLDDQRGVSIATLTADATVSVLESSSTLRVSWRAPSNDNGFGISSYLIEYWVSQSVEEVQEIAIQSPSASPAEGTFALSYMGEKTDSLSIDASAEDVKLALEGLAAVRSVHVWRSGSNPQNAWTVTFNSEWPSISGKALRVENAVLSDAAGGTPTVQVHVVTPGSRPIGYTSSVIEVEDALQTRYNYTLTNLTPGQPYHVQVSAANQLGYGPPQASLPRELAPPVQKPSEPTNVVLSVASSQSLEVVFSKPESDGGDTVSLYRIEWATDFDAGGGEVDSYTFVSPKNGQGCNPCVHQITGLVKGQDYYVRVYSYNSHGYSVEPGLPTPRFLSPKTTPDPPGVLEISPQSDHAIQVSFPHTLDDGGAPVTKYRVAWAAQGYAAGGPSANDDHTALLYSPHNVQSITLTADEDDLGGVFRVAFEGHPTDEISAKATANDVKLALESLPTVGSVVVSRETLTNGFALAVTFLTNHGHQGRFGPIDALTVSTDPAASPQAFVTDTLGAAGGSLLGTGARLVVKDEVTAFKGFEQQTLTTQCATSGGILDGHFALSFEGVLTNEIAPDATHQDVKLALESIGSGTVKVTRRKIHDRINASEFTIIFLDRLGNVPLLKVALDHLICSDGSAGPHIFVTETVQGLLPRMDGPNAGEIELNPDDYADGNVVHTVDGLMRGMPYHIQVSAWNGAGESYGRAQYSTPALMVPMDRPDPPSSVDMKPIDDATLQISWDASLIKGGLHQIDKFRVELTEAEIEETETFDVTNAPEIQLITLEATADDMGGSFAVYFEGERSSDINVDSTEEQVQEALAGISIIDDVDVSIVSHTQDASTPSYGQRWTITFSARDGNLPSLLLDTGSAPPCVIATGGTLIGSSSVVRVETIQDGGLPTSFVTPATLSSSKSYTARVSTFNGHSWSNPASSRYSISPSKSAPSPPREVHVNVLSDTEIGVSWRRPRFSGGSPVSAYKVEYSPDLQFGHASVTVNEEDKEREEDEGDARRYAVLDGLDPNESYYVRVLASSASGFSAPASAVPMLANTQIFELTLVESAGSLDYTEIFQLVMNGMETNPLSVLATAQDIENELNALLTYGAVSVDREDRSTVYDSSGVETNYFDMRFGITLFGDEMVTLAVNSDSLGSVVATVEDPL